MKKWSVSGFEELSKGSFGDSAPNLYVSKKGVLQRIWRFDVNQDGYVDLLIANSHDYAEHPDTYIISDPCGKAECKSVLTTACQAGHVCDFNGDGFADVILAANNDGHHCDLASYVYFGGPDGITENRKIDLAAPGCCCVVSGDFDGDGETELCYLVSTSPEVSFSPALLYDYRLRVYHKNENGIGVECYKDYPTPDLTWFVAGDVDGDGCDDLYCRTKDGQWIVLWGSKDGFDRQNCTEVAPPTDDGKRFDLLGMGGGNVEYHEFCRPKFVKHHGKEYLFYANEKEVQLIRFDGRSPSEKIVLPIPNVIEMAIGHMDTAESEDMVFLQVNSLEDQKALVYFERAGLDAPVRTMPVLTPRDVILADLSGNGHDDIVIALGRGHEAYTTESHLYPVDENGKIAEEPRRFTTHNCIEVYAEDVNGDGKLELIFFNQQESAAYGHIPVHVYLGGPDGYKGDRRLEFLGHSAGTMVPCDFNDDGYPDILIMQNGEDQPQLNLPSDLYFGGPDGFSTENMTQIDIPLAWGGHCADLNKDGYLDILGTCGRELRIAYGSAEGWRDEDIQILYTAPENGGGNLWMAVADLNGDGWLDVVVPVSNECYSLIFWGSEKGFSEDNKTTLPIECALTVRVADLNKDGYPDLIFGSRASEHKDIYHEGTVTIYWGSKNGYSVYNCCVLPSYQSNCISIQDIDGDGWLDIFVSSYFNKRERDINSFIYWNDHGNFSVTNRKRFFAHSSSASWVGDFNEDGYMDICLTHHRAYGSHRTDSAIWWQGPDGFSENNRTWLPTIGPHDMVPCDIGHIMDRSPEEKYITAAFEAEGINNVGWEAVIPQKTWINCQIRTAESREALESAPFTGPDGTDKTRFEKGEAIDKKLIAGKWMQIKLFIGAVNSGNTPRITEIWAK